MSEDVEKAAQGWLEAARQKNLEIARQLKQEWKRVYDGQEIREAFLAGAEWGREQERYMAEQRGRIDAMLEEIAIERVKAAILAGEKEGK